MLGPPMPKGGMPMPINRGQNLVEVGRWDMYLVGAS
jgi:hypothetical protein